MSTVVQGILLAVIGSYMAIAGTKNLGLTGVNTLFNALLNNKEFQQLDFSTLHLSAGGGMPVQQAVAERWVKLTGQYLLEGYGLTECAPLVSVNPHDIDYHSGSIGLPVPSTEAKLVDDDDNEVAPGEPGELCVRGPQVMLGYWQRPDATDEIIKNGWLHTGDVGVVDEEGFFRITDRMKDIIITAGGKNITPSELENELKFSPYITDAVVIGDKRAYLTVIIMIDQENVEKFAQDADIPFSNYASLTRAPEVQELIQKEIDRVNQKFARVEQIKKFFLLDTQLTAEDEELTPTMKLKRKLVEKKYAAQIEAMY